MKQRLLSIMVEDNDILLTYVDPNSEDEDIQFISHDLSTREGFLIYLDEGINNFSVNGKVYEIEDVYMSLDIEDEAFIIVGESKIKVISKGDKKWETD